MSLRTRVTVFTSLLVAAAVITVSWAGYRSAREEARDEIDTFLMTRGMLLGVFDGTYMRLGPIARPSRYTVGPIPVRNEAVFQVIDASGNVTLSLDDISLPIDQMDRGVAVGLTGPILRDVRVDGIHYRMLTHRAGEGVAVQMARDLTETDTFLADLRARLILIGGAAVVIAGLGAWFISRRALRPVGQLTDAAAHIAETGELDTSIDVNTRDEVGHLAESFNTMLEALSSSRSQQRRLVADAGHELRTPLTSLRTNIELLARADDMDVDQRSELLADATHELAELSTLVAELVELAAAPTDEPTSQIRLDKVVAEEVDRARRRTRRQFDLEGDSFTLDGRPGRLHRAVANLLANAEKWSRPDTPIEVLVRGGRVEVRDHGSGIEPEDLPHIFDRFYRSATARAMPGSGLGLSIVKQVAEEHGGSVFAGPADGGGSVVGFEIPQEPG
jgi:two-component system sensor histidine kinase MprB